MLNVLYFARLRETLGLNCETLDFVEGETVGEFRKRLSAKHGDNGKMVERADIKIAVNQVVAKDVDLLTDNVEIALFPPVTGG